jgi:hypothetical protein
MEFTWIAIIASLCMGIGAALVFVYAAKKNYFHNIDLSQSFAYLRSRASVHIIHQFLPPCAPREGASSQPARHLHLGTGTHLLL